MGRDAAMSNKQALLSCTFSWGKTCRLYLDSLEIAGKFYKLDDLTSVRPAYRMVFGVPSASLELFFGQRRIVLRGIPDLETTRLMVSHLQPYCSDQPRAARSRFHPHQTRDAARAQARAWERTNKMPAIPASPEQTSSTQSSEIPRHSPLSPLVSLVDAQPFEPVDEALVSDMPLAPEARINSFEQFSHDFAAYQPEDSLSASNLRPLHTPGFQPPLRSVHLVQPERKRMLDSRSVPVPAFKSHVLPVIHVPVRLQAGECAHYSIGATLCSDRISGSERAPYPPLDHGLLILTNRRIFYTGKRSQLILAYTHLWYVSLLHNAIALHIEGQFRRIIIELEHPEEWASRIEQLSFIARRSRPRPELPTVSMPALPGLSASTLLGATLKRPVVKTPNTTSGAAPDAGMPLLPEQAASKIVEATTISFDEPADQQYTEIETRKISPASLAEEVVTEDFSQRRVLEEIATQEFSDQPGPEDGTALELTYETTPLEEDLSGSPYQTTPLEEETQDSPYQTEPLEEETRDLSYQTMPLDTATLPDGEVETVLLHDQPALSAFYTWNERKYEEIDTLPLRGRDEREDEETPTISLRDQYLVHAETISLAVPSPAQSSELEATSPRLPRVRAPRQPHYAGKEWSG
jgi:hypothetical protein